MTSATHDMAKYKVPILLLKTKSTPGDAYQDIFSQAQNGLSFDPSFVPVLEHTFDNHGMAKVGLMLKGKQIGSHLGASYGGLIFTSQRAVEAFTMLVHTGQGETCLVLGFPIHLFADYGDRKRKPIATSPGSASIQRGTGHN